ncbi:MAG: hypothetical protein EOM34_08830 [Clostridia bacterium]|nr:hypothetical protein [Lachnospiraceae bacterium]NCC00770.1 hypothetical protein [Clostridia bacterium]NCD03134.1 hypothetical protein [Clostridia bacterium]
MKNLIKTLFIILTVVTIAGTFTGCGKDSAPNEKRIKEDILATGVTDLYRNGWETMNVESVEITDHRTTEYSDSVLAEVYVVTEDGTFDRWALCTLRYGKYEQGWILEDAEWEHDFSKEQGEK